MLLYLLTRKKKYWISFTFFLMTMQIFLMNSFPNFLSNREKLRANEKQFSLKNKKKKQKQKQNSQFQTKFNGFYKKTECT